MSFIAKHITHHDERLIYLARLHWIYIVKGIWWLILLGGFGIFINWLVLFKLAVLPSSNMPFLSPAQAVLFDLVPGLIPAITGIIIFLVYLFKVLGTEIALTNKRLIFKTGLMFVQSTEVELAEVSECSVDNGFFGAFVGYGSIHLDCRFVGDFNLPVIKEPYQMLRQINKLRIGHEGDTLPKV